MKIVQSFWSKPTKGKSSDNLNIRSAGGWSSNFYNYMTWAFSCLKFCEFYDQVELVTDKAGFDLLINKLKLPYTNCQVVLDNLNHLDPGLWAMGKIYAYQLQNEPFIHADGDVFIWERFPKRLEESKLLAQNSEKDTIYYDIQYDKVKDQFDYIPEIIRDERRKGRCLNAINAGIIGGNDIDFFQEYTYEAMKTVESNIHCMGDIDKGELNIFYEQCIFYILAQNKKISINYLFDQFNEEYDGISNITAAPSDIKYAHSIGFYKRRKAIGELLANMLLTEYPEYYFRIVQLIRDSKIL